VCQNGGCLCYTAAAALKKMLDRVFMKKTRRGNILKIVRGHYLRDDLSCGSELCTSPACTAVNRKQRLLESQPVSPNKSYARSHYLVPDTNIILHQVIILLLLLGHYFVAELFFF
jgi:exosome complex exonuclease DIS3/RRP44